MLSKEFKLLELNGLLKRVMQADKTPVIVEYVPTEYAKTLKGVFAVLAEWEQKHKKRITAKL